MVVINKCVPVARRATTFHKEPNTSVGYYEDDDVFFKSSRLAKKLALFHEELDASDVEDIASLEPKFEELKTCVADFGEPNQYSQSISWFARKINHAKKKMDHQDEINQLEESMKNLESRVLDLKIPVIKNPGKRFEDLMKEAEEIEQRINKHVDNCYAIANLRDNLQYIKEKILQLEEDNKMFLGWTSTSTVLSGASIGIAFIPIAGLPIAAVMVAVPYFGKLFHRLAVSHKRKRQFKQNALKAQAEAQSTK